MAQTRRRRRRKHRGTQAGSVDRRARGRPRSRAEARARARRTQQDRSLTPPSWRSAINKGLIAAAIFFALLALAFGRPPVASLFLSVFMLAFYVPMAYFTDRFFFRRRMRQLERERLERAQRRDGG
jgi:hypothetical protein